PITVTSRRFRQGLVSTALTRITTQLNPKMRLRGFSCRIQTETGADVRQVQSGAPLNDAQICPGATSGGGLNHSDDSRERPAPNLRKISWLRAYQGPDGR